MRIVTSRCECSSVQSMRCAIRDGARPTRCPFVWKMRTHFQRLHVSLRCCGKAGIRTRLGVLRRPRSMRSSGVMSRVFTSSLCANPLLFRRVKDLYHQRPAETTRALQKNQARARAGADAAPWIASSCHTQQAASGVPRCGEIDDLGGAQGRVETGKTRKTTISPINPCVVDSVN